MAFSGFKYAPVPACCCNTDPCLIGSDTFDGGLGSWTIIVGSPGTSGGSLVASAGDVLIFTAGAATEDDGTHSATAPETASGTATMRMIAGWEDANNYLFGELKIAGGVGTIQLGQVAGGSSAYLTEPETLEDVDAELNDRSSTNLCYQPGEPQTPESFTSYSFPYAAVGTSWTDPNNVLLDDADSAQWGGTFGAGAITNSLAVTKFDDLSIPPGSTIDGISVSVKHADLSIDSDYVIDWDVRLLDRDGNLTGNNQAELTLIGGTVPVLRAYGDDTDDWGAGLTWEDVNSSNFGVSLIYKNNGPDNQATVIVQVVTISVWFTTPDRAGGSLVFSYQNTSNPANIQCVRRSGIYSEGLQTGLAFPAGNWDLTHYSVGYRAHAELHPECTDCVCTVVDGPPCECCTTEFPPALQMSVDLGAGGWTNDCCSYCDQIGGTYILDGSMDCGWTYGEFFGDGCAACDCACAADRGLVLHLRLEDDGSGGCKWVLGVHVFAPCDPSHTGGCGSHALYEAPSSIASNEDCQTGPVTLNQTTAATDEDCNGALPGTVDIDVV